MPSRDTRARMGRPPRDLLTVLEAVNALEPSIHELPDRELRLHGNDLAARLAVAREAAIRTLGERPHDTQVLGAAAMATGRAIEMVTGEGKTLAAAMAAIALTRTAGKVHVATANDYLAARDTDWMAPLFTLLGISVGATGPAMEAVAKRAAYACDITYGTAREFAFDYLRDTLAADPGSRVQHGHSVALIDEIDFVLLDEARVPFVITRSTPVDGAGLGDAAELVAGLDAQTDFHIDDAQRTAWLTEPGIDRVEAVIGRGAMDDPDSLSAANVQTALRARCCLRRDRDYVVVEDRVRIVDEFTGRILPGRRWADGLHQAVEAKEGVPVREDTRPLAQITVRSYFDRYDTLVGMSGTGLRAAREFKDVHGLDMVAIPPHRPVVRIDRPDRIFPTAEGKYEAVVAEVVRRHTTGQPVLVGTTTVGHSEYLSALLVERDIEHRVLNAKHHAVEAAIIAEAGQLGAVTVATNMAGRGVDIKLGDGVAGLGGLCVIGTERHESRRVDDQLRGRAGRQGDPGESVFYSSLEDDLVVNHGPRLGLSGPRRAVNAAQGNADIHNQKLRATTHEYDEILDGQYAELCRFRSEVVDEPSFDQWTEDRVAQIGGDALTRMRRQQDRAGEAWGSVQRAIMYHVLERGWPSVLETMYGLRNWVNLVAFGGQYPITEWRRRSDAAIAAMQDEVEAEYVATLLAANIVSGRPPETARKEREPVDVVTERGAPVLPVTARHESAHREPLVPDWAEGFAGPQFQEVVQVVDPSGASPGGVALRRLHDTVTVWVEAAPCVEE